MPVYLCLFKYCFSVISITAMWHFCCCCFFSVTYEMVCGYALPKYTSTNKLYYFFFFLSIILTIGNTYRMDLFRIESLWDLIRWFDFKYSTLLMWKWHWLWIFLYIWIWIIFHRHRDLLQTCLPIFGSFISIWHNSCELRMLVSYASVATSNFNTSTYNIQICGRINSAPNLPTHDVK